MSDDRLQLQRFELKYIVDEDRALAVRDFVSSYLEIDEYGATQPNLSYPVHSLYLDSPALQTYHWTVNGRKNRFKLRIRFYDNNPAAPVYFEIKRRMNDAILKQRGAVKRGHVDWVLQGHLPEPDHLVSSDPRHLVAVQQFSRFMNEMQARPTAHVAYRREAWISPHDNSVRVTMDRDVRCDPEPTAAFRAEMRDPMVVFGRQVVLELKFTGRFPDWFRHVVEAFNLQQVSAAKYADGLTLLGEQRVLAAHLAVLPELAARPAAAARLAALRRREPLAIPGPVAPSFAVV
jgi:hypothetical protein